MNESDLKLALALHTNQGVYSFLIGSGVSRAAGIQTGWDIVLDLIGKLAVMKKENVSGDPAAWYRTKFEEAPDYSKLLERLAAEPAERRNLLRSYFEPTEIEQERGLKKPTNAHNALAHMVKNGYVKLILTTNFDRLIESALQEQSIVPSVISSEDDLAGALPYVHSRCTIVKLNGDYLDTRIKNTPEELANYSEAMNKFLNRVFDEFGLVICGWSGEWDSALRSAILRAPNRRFTTFWLTRGSSLTDGAKEIITKRLASTISISSADEFFLALQEKLESLKQLEASDPISTAVAVTSVQRYLAEPRYRILLNEMLSRETERLYAVLSSEKFDTGGEVSKNIAGLRIGQYEGATERLASMLGTIGYYGSGTNSKLLESCIERLSDVPRHSGKKVLIDLQYYPALLVTYTAGVAAVAARRPRNLAAILLVPEYYEQEGNFNKKLPGVYRLNPNMMFTRVPVPEGWEAHKSPGSWHLFEWVYGRVQDFLPSMSKYQEDFDLFEYLLSLVFIDRVTPTGLPVDWTPGGMFSWRYAFTSWEDTPMGRFEQTALQSGNNWELLKAGFFNQSLDHFKQIVKKEHELRPKT